MRKILISLLVLALAAPGVFAQKKKPAKAPAKKPAAAAPATPAAAVPAAAENAEQPGIDEATAKKYDVSAEFRSRLKRKRVLNDKDFAKKKEGGFFTGLHWLTPDPNTGFGYGARVFFFQNSKKEDPLFRRTPYRHQIYAQFFQTTYGYKYHELNWDSPYIMNSLFRVRSAIVFEKNIWANYFGTGARTMNTLAFGPTSYDKYAEYNDKFAKVNANRATPTRRFNRYSFERPAAVAFF